MIKNPIIQMFFNNFALSDAEDNTSGPLKRGGIADLPLLRTLLKKTLWSLFMDWVQLSPATSRRQFTFYNSVPRNPWYSFYRPRKDERLRRPWSHPVVLNTGPLHWESSTLTTRQGLK